MGTNTVRESMKLVSVIIPFLNEEAFLEEAVESVLKQGYSHWELLLVDDGSTDISTEIARNYAAQHPAKIKYLEHPGHQNKGLSATRNLGVKQAKGALVALLDADDAWLPNKLAEQVAIFEAHPGIGMVVEAGEYWYTWSDPKKENVIIPVGVAPGRVYEAKQLAYHLYPLASGAAPCPSGLMIAKAAFERSGYFEESFRKEFGLYEDQAFLVKIYLGEEVYVSGSCGHLYRQRPESIVSQVHAQGLYHRVRRYYLEWLQVYLKSNKIEDRKLHKLLKKALWPYHHPILYAVSRAPAQVLNLSKRVLPHEIKQKIKHRLNF